MLVSLFAYPLLAQDSGAGSKAKPDRGQLDSLITVLKQSGTSLEKKAEICTQLLLKWNQRDPDSAKYYGHLGIRYGRQSRIAQAYFYPASELSAMYREQGLYDSAYLHLYPIIDSARSWGDSISVAHCYKDLGILSRRELKFDEGIALTLQALDLLKQHAPQDHHWMTIYYTSLGRLYDEKGDYLRAVEAFQTAHKIADANRQAVARAQRGIALYFLGTTHLKNGAFQEAEAVIAKYDSFARERSDYEELYQMGNHGLIALFLKDTTLALKYHESSLARAREMEDSKRRAIASGNIAILLHNLGKHEEAIGFAHESIKYSRKDLETTNSALQVMHQAQASLGRSDSAYFYLLKYNALHESMRLDQQSARIDKLEVAFRTKEQEQQLALQEIQLEKARTARTQLLLLLGLALLALVLLYLLLRQRAEYAEQLAIYRGNQLEKQEQEHKRENELSRIRAMLDGQEAERKRIAQDLHDGLGGLLASVKAHLTSHKNEVGLPNEAAYQKGVLLLDKAYAEVRQIAHSLMPQALAMNSLGAAIEDLLAVLEAQDIDVDYQLIGPADEVLSEQERVTVYRILQELVANTLRHSDAQGVMVQILADSDRFSLVFEDDGKGFDSSAITERQGLGINSLRSRVNLLGGDIDLSSTPGEGTSITITLPLRQKALS